ncbi:general transcription factor II-I repeat domain-containing protein 2A-like [Onthophagus taurus]|uniref:general transcription factor II-I repeat domain-containing protein 2A-like n=1 Tax=Onthophagus taurus TaxID=166361 RepID=UPI0039BDAA38
MTTVNKKRKYEEENRCFRSEWEESFAFIEYNGKSLCLICKDTIANYKISNLRRHYETTHPQFSIQYPPSSKLRKEKLMSLKNCLQKQQGLLASCSNEDIRKIEASFIISWNIAREKRPYVEGEFIKNNLVDVINILEPTNEKLLKLITQIPTSRRTTERRISIINKSIENTLKYDLNNCTAFSIALDESTDIQDIPQLAIFVRCGSEEVHIKEELLDLVALRETTRGIDIKNAFNMVLNNFHLPIDKLVSVATDGAPAMTGKNQGLIGLLKSDPKIPKFVPIHCIIHREHIISKYLKFENVWNIVLKVIHFIRVNAKTHRQFKNFLEELKEDGDKSPNDISFYCIVRWLSVYNVLNRFNELLTPICIFLKEQGRQCLELEDKNWLQDFSFLTDTMQHLHTLNLALQGKEKTNVMNLSF